MLLLSAVFDVSTSLRISRSASRSVRSERGMPQMSDSLYELRNVWIWLIYWRKLEHFGVIDIGNMRTRSDTVRELMGQVLLQQDLLESILANLSRVESASVWLLYLLASYNKVYRTARIGQYG